jgi:hypothetical protein
LKQTNDGGQPAITYEYNAIGNITSRQVGSNTFSYTYHPTKKHAVSNVNLNGSNDAFTYDANGNMTSGYDLTEPTNVGSRTITWNADNLPSRIQYTQGGTTATVDFSYDGEVGGWKKAKLGGPTTYCICRCHRDHRSDVRGELETQNSLDRHEVIDYNSIRI